MNVLDTIDTTVTCEWGNTRTIGTLIELGGRRAVVTALRAPEPDTPIFLRVEGESQDEAIAIDGVATVLTDSDWGERQIEIAIQRVGTTSSAAVLRAFVERHQIDRGGSVSIGRNRDNPELKRFVYLLPDPRTAQVEREAQATRPTVPLASPAPEPAPEPAMEPAPQGGAESTVDDDATRLLPVAEPGRAQLDRTRAEGLRALTPADGTRSPVPWSALGDAQIADDVPPPSDSPSDGFEIDLSTDVSEPILVNTVEHGVSMPSPVLQMPAPGRNAPVGGETGPSLVRRLFASIRGNEGRPETRAEAAEAAPRGPSLDAEPRAPVATPRPRPSSGSIQAVQQLFAVDQAIRVERPMQFESGKKRHTGVLVRLAESKLRVRSNHSPKVYERITVVLLGDRGPKDILELKCEVTRVRTGATDGADADFDARVAGANSAATMARLRDLIEAWSQPDRAAS